MTREERANNYAEHNIDKYTNEYANIYNAYLKGAEEETKELEAQIEKMKCCANCEYYSMEFLPYFCIKRQIPTHCIERCDKWEIKEND